MATSFLAMRYCLACGQPLALSSRADARYCSTRCRVTAHRRRHGSGYTAADLDRLPGAAGPIAEPLLLAAVQAAVIRGSWEAAAWTLPRRWPQRWGAAAGRVAREADLLDELEPDLSESAA
jgi:hypothetical protein